MIKDWGIEELMLYLTANSNEWHLEINGHEGTYETREQYIKGTNDEEMWSDELNDGLNLYRVQIYPTTPISCYVIFGTDLKDVLVDAYRAIEPHRRGGKLPIRLEHLNG